ncbi:M20 metallopeptidase family protein [Catalinimonas niigatensis]|uniref:M20 metallopeptidase family protein n=1 Tax=Catalinimonas niigatensis TaxID=1397264 RepID=UPI0026659270|nr:M20 family metallopeptidase [Catalinimonas niigatensis]WPP52750.1 M20 family metallopeptidase [Catalinimonas niigatensis]
MDLKEKIKSLTQENVSEIVNIRRHLHSHPELSFQEYQTAQYVADKLKSFGIVPTEGVADTGLVAMIEGKNPQKKVIALRADMDALPIQEENDVPYKSTKPGVMHACGHDVHTASLLGTARVLSQLKEDFEGSVKLIFQPGEEKIPGGASLMIKAGALESPAPNHIFGQHVLPHLPAGKVGFREGMYMASADEIYITVTGKGGHAAMPEKNIDPILITSHIIVALQQIVSRHASPKMPTVLSFGRVIADGATNIIPNEVKVEGTFRTMDEEWRAKAHHRMRAIAESLAEGMGGKCELEIRKGYPFLKNSPELTQRAKNYAIDLLGQESVVDLDLWMAAEDFSYYSQIADACFYRLGTGNEAQGISSSVHTPTFDIDEDALQTGVSLMSWITIQELRY